MQTFNSAYLFKDIWGETGTFSFFLSSFSILISQQHGVSTLYILSVVKGECVFFLLSYIYKDGVLKKICGFLWNTNHEHSVGVFIKLPCMYSMHVNVVVQAWLQYI